MAHEVETMFYYGAVPWHKQGKEVMKALTAEDAIKEAGLDWAVKTVSVYAHDARGRVKKIEGKKAIQRDSDGAVFAVLGDGYKPVQNVDAFKFFDDVVGTGEAKYHTAGSLRGGARVWILAKAKGSIGVAGDEIERFLLLVNGHDGAMALRMMFTPVRVVCMNTLQAALDGADNATSFYARHTAGVMGRVDIAREVLGMTNSYYKDFKAKGEVLAAKPFPASRIPDLLTATFGAKLVLTPADVAGAGGSTGMFDRYDLSTRLKNQFDRIEALIDHGKGNDRPGIHGTAWAALNGVVEYLDYAKKYSGADPDGNRLFNVWGGRGLMAKNRAFNYLLKV